MKTTAGQTHFVGVTVSGALAETVKNCRRWMHERYGCKSGHNTPPHVTLIPPFMITDNVSLRDFEHALASFISKAKPFRARVSGFGAFAERTVFANVIPDASWKEWHDQLYDVLVHHFQNAFAIDKKRFTPHITISNRDIPTGAVPETLTHFAALGLESEISVDHIALFQRVDARWDIRNGWYCE